MFKVEIKELLLLYITIQGFISYIPQIVKLIRRKTADDIALSTYIIWTINSSAFLIYIILDGCGIYLILSQVFEVILVGSTTLIACVVRTRRRKDA